MLTTMQIPNLDAILIITLVALTILLMTPIIFSQQQDLLVNAQKQPQQSVSGIGQGILPGDVPTLFSFKAVKHKDGTLSGTFECFAVMPDGKTMYVNGTVRGLVLSTNGTSVMLTGPTVVYGFGAGTGTFKAVATTSKEGVGTSNNNGTLVLTTDVNGDGIQAHMPDGSEGPFNEKILKGSIKLSQ
jgi:hypothetical protein